MKRILILFILVGLATVSSPASAACPPAAQGQLRSDGIYVYYAADEGVYYVLRFYPDGVVISVSVVDDPDLTDPEVLFRFSQWFNVEENPGSFGCYQVQGPLWSGLRFSTTSTRETELEVVVVDYVGLAVNSQRLLLYSYSYANGHRALHAYNFIPVDWTE
jgi:hypothetical protein